MPVTPSELLSFVLSFILSCVLHPQTFFVYFIATLVHIIGYVYFGALAVIFCIQKRDYASFAISALLVGIFSVRITQHLLRFYSLTSLAWPAFIFLIVSAVLIAAMAIAVSYFFPKFLAIPGPEEVRQMRRRLSEHQDNEKALLKTQAVLHGEIDEKNEQLVRKQKALEAENSERCNTERILQEREKHFRALTENALDITVVLDKEGALRYQSPSVEKVLGYRDHQLKDQSVFDLIHPKDVRLIKKIFFKSISFPGAVRAIEFRLKHANGSWKVLEAVGKSLLNDPVVQGIIVNARDITERRQTEKEMQLLPQIVHMIGETDDFYGALETAVVKVCETTGWAYGEAWVLKGEGKALECAFAWAENSQLGTFKRLSQELRFLPGMDLPGQVWSSKKPVWLRDTSISANSFFTRSQIAKQAEIKAGLGVPIISVDQRLLAILVFFMLESRPEDKKLVHLVSTVASQLGAVIQRKRVEEVLRQSQEELERRIKDRTQELKRINEKLQAEVNERRSTEFSLERSQKNYQTFMNSIDGILWEYDVEAGKYTFVSEQAERILGYPLQGWFEDHTFWQDQVHGQDRELALAFRARVIEQKKESHLEYRMITADGRIVWLRDIVSTQVEEDRVVKLRGLMIDITQRKLMEEALHEERNFAAAVLDTASALVMVLDTEGRIVRFNRACERTTGYTINDLKGKFFWDVFLVPDEVERVKTIFARLLAGQFPTNFESYWLTKNNNQLIVAWSNTVLMTKQGLATHVIATGIDVTRRREVEKKLTQAFSDLARSNQDLDQSTKELKEANARLQKMDETKSHFISAASHELRTPLTSLKGYVEMILQDEVGPINEKQREFLTYVKESTDRLHRLLNELLDISKIESGQVQMNLELTDIRALLKEEIMIFKPQADEKELHLSLETDSELTEIYCDADKIREVMDNLINNALKYTMRKGRVKVLARNYDHGVRIEVQDTGIGIKKEDLSKIFEPFQHIEKNGTELEESTGLGLALVRKIVEVHGGQVAVKSQFGKGSTFIVDLPQGVNRREKNQPQWVMTHE